VIGLVSKVRFGGRVWYYFRIGYATYLTFLLGAVNTLIVIWYLAIRDAPDIENLFGHFGPFAVLATVVGVPLAILIGWIHYKRSAIYTSEADIGWESDPYSYKFPPGYWREAFGPFYLELLVETKQLLEARGLLDQESKTRIENLEQKLRILSGGGMAGQPRRRL